MSFSPAPDVESAPLGTRIMSSPYRTLSFALALSILAATPVAAQDIQWRFKPPLGLVDSSPAVVDMNGDGISDIVMTTTAGSVLAVDHKGQQIWMRGVQIPISIPPTVVDLVEDETPEVLVVNQSGHVYCMAGKTGDPIWDYSLPGKIEWGTTALAAYDLDGDGALEIIAADDGGHVVCLSRDGEKVWQYDGTHGHGMCPAVGLIGDRKEPVVVLAGPKAALVCLDAQGKVLWQLEGKNGASPVIADIDGDGQNEIVGGQDNAVIAADATGRVLWQHAMPKTIDSSIAVADADENGVNDIYAIDLAGTVVALAPDGSLQWTANVRERVRRSPAIADVDGDGKLEVVVAGYSGEMYLFRGDGELKETVPMPNTTNASPTIADLSGDGTPSVIYVTGTGDLLAYRWPGAKPGANVQWPEYRFSSARQGAYVPRLAQSPVRIAAIDFGDLYAGANTVSVSVDNPEAAALRVEIRIERSGADPLVVPAVSGDTQVTVTADYLLDSLAPTVLAIACHVYVGDSLVAKRSTEAYVAPFQREMADLADLLAVVQAQAGALPEAYAILGEMAALEGRVPGYRDRVAASGTHTDVGRRELRDTLRGEIGRLRDLDVLTRAALAHRKTGAWPVQLAAANPWAPSGALDEVLEGRMGETAVRVEAFQGETESAAVNAINWSPATQTVRVEIDDLACSGQESVLWHNAIRLHEVIDIPTQTLDKSADALPTMNQGQVWTLPGWDGRQLWLTIDTKGLQPGTWTTTVHLRTLEVQSTSFDIPLTVEVWKTKLADTNVLRHCNWGYVAGSRLKDYEAASIADRVAHGNNVFVCNILPRATYGANGNPTGDIDFTANDEYVRKYAPHGMILFQNYNPITTPAPLDSEAYAKAYAHFLRAWVKHLADLGVGYDGFAMYPIDEPGLNDGLVAAYLRNAKLTRAADPKVRMYTDPVARITGEELHEMTPYVDIWCPNRVGFLLDVGAEKLKIMQDSGAAMWNYECLGNAKHQSPLGYYRGQAWLAWRHGLTGIGFWSYCTSSADPWYRPQDTLDYLLIYQGDGVVASKRWEAVRDGVEDYAMLHALREAMERARAAGTHPEDVGKAEKLLTDQATAIAQFCGLDEYGTEPGKGGIPAVRTRADGRFAEIQLVRRELADLLQRLAG